MNFGNSQMDGHPKPVQAHMFTRQTIPPTWKTTGSVTSDGMRMSYLLIGAPARLKMGAPVFQS